jgi:hypothetical protein
MKHIILDDFLACMKCLCKWAIQLLIGVQDEDSCGKSVLGETPQERSDEEAHQPPAESEVLHGNQ